MSFTSSSQIVVQLDENSQVGDARRNAVRIAELSALNETDQGKVAIIATELANNLVRHGTKGEMIIRRCRSTHADGVEIIAFDRGPGMGDVQKCMEDGFSTGGTSGTGLGAIKRLSTEFDVHSQRPSGTIIVSRLLCSISDASTRGTCGVICIPAPGESLSGDNWSIAEKEEVISILLVDGLGHGPLAATAADEAVRVFNTDPFREPGILIDAIHGSLRSTRGAAVAIAHANLNQRQIKYAGIGNISGTLISGESSRGLFSHNGTVGLQIRKIQQFEYPWPEKALLIMHSDGLQGRWNLLNAPALMNRDPAVIAGSLYRDHKRGRDDLTVAVVR